MASIIEQSYPITYHQHEAALLGQHIKNKHAVVLIGMKRVGISNFLRFFLYHKDIVKTYIADGKQHLFIPVDLNDLIEREIPPFWTLTLKRIVDAVASSDLSEEVKKKIEDLFLDSIQTQDLFFTIDNVRKSLLMIIEQGVRPTLFFVLFDRMKDAITPEFFANLQGIREATHQELTYVLTSFRSLDVVSPDVFKKAEIAVYYHNMSIRPVIASDMRTIYQTYKKQYGLHLAKDVEDALFSYVDGYVRYMHLSLILLNELKESLPQTKEALWDLLTLEERIILQSEELWESLTLDEQTVLQKLVAGRSLTEEEREKASYLWETGFIRTGKGEGIFSPLFLQYLKNREKKNAAANGDFTKKEHLLFQLLKENLNDVCEREDIAQAVWPEEQAIGVSDWAIDRLVARVRGKLKQQNTYEIQTVKTRGYKLVPLQ